MPRGPVRRPHAWLSITPEPERELPAAVAAAARRRMPRQRAGQGGAARHARQHAGPGPHTSPRRPAGSPTPLPGRGPRARARRHRQPRQPEAWTSRRTLMTISRHRPATATDFSARAARAARARAALRRRGPDPQRGAGRAQRREDPRRAARSASSSEAIEARLSGGLHAPEHGGQGWTQDRVVPRGGAARPLDQRAVLAHARRLQRAGQRHARADRALPQARAARRAARRLRGHRGRGGLRPLAHRDHRRGARTPAG